MFGSSRVVDTLHNYDQLHNWVIVTKRTSQHDDQNDYNSPSHN